MQTITTTSIGSKEEPYPMLANVWDFFSAKGTKTVFVSVGTGSSCLPDLDFAETLGCKILKCDTPSDSQKWKEVTDILKSRKFTDATSEYAKVATKKWVLPKNIVLQECIPSFSNGTIVVDGTSLQTKSWSSLLKDHITEGDPHVDILKVDSCPYEIQVLTSLLEGGFRPSLLLIHWTESPDECLRILNMAAHLQMLGYCLVAKEGKRFLYYYTDVNYYEVCSWETVSTKFENPLMREFVRSIFPGGQGGVAFPLQK